MPLIIIIIIIIIIMIVMIHRHRHRRHHHHQKVYQQTYIIYTYTHVYHIYIIPPFIHDVCEFLKMKGPQSSPWVFQYHLMVVCDLDDLGYPHDKRETST